MVFLLGIKYDFIKRFPWIVVGVAHYEAEVARSIARKIVEMWEEMPEDVQKLQHRVVRRLMEGKLREQLDSFIAGTDLCDLPELEFFGHAFFSLAVCCWLTMFTG